MSRGSGDSAGERDCHLGDALMGGVVSLPVSATSDAGSRAKGGFDWRSAVALVVLLAAVTALFLTAPFDKDMWWSDAPRHAMDGAFYRDFLRYLPLSYAKQWAMNYYIHYPALA